MDLRKIKKLIELVEESGISELEVTSADEGVRIVRPLGAVVTAATSQPQSPAAPSESAPTPPPAAASMTVAAPMAGTFYVAPEPGAAPFAPVGTTVEAGAVLCIVESMKMMNEIRAESGGTVVEVLVENGQPIATGQGLFRLS